MEVTKGSDVAEGLLRTRSFSLANSDFLENSKGPDCRSDRDKIAGSFLRN